MEVEHRRAIKVALELLEYHAQPHVSCEPDLGKYELAIKKLKSLLVDPWTYNKPPTTHGTYWLAQLRPDGEPYVCEADYIGSDWWRVYGYHMQITNEFQYAWRPDGPQPNFKTGTK